MVLENDNPRQRSSADKKSIASSNCGETENEGDQENERWWGGLRLGVNLKLRRETSAPIRRMNEKCSWKKVVSIREATVINQTKYDAYASKSPTRDLC